MIFLWIFKKLFSITAKWTVLITLSFLVKHDLRKKSRSRLLSLWNPTLFRIDLLWGVGNNEYALSSTCNKYCLPGFIVFRVKFYIFRLNSKVRTTHLHCTRAKINQLQEFPPSQLDDTVPATLASKNTRTKFISHWHLASVPQASYDLRNKQKKTDNICSDRESAGRVILF